MPNPSTPTRKDQKLLLAAAGLAGSSFFWGPLSILLLPIVYLNTHLHELCHALMGFATGGDAGPIKVFANGEGVTMIRGGSILLIGSAGYVGSIVAGSILVALCRTEKGARTGLTILACSLGLSMLTLVRGDLVGITSGLLWLLVLAIGIKKLQGPSLIFTATFLGMMQCLQAVASLRDLLLITQTSQGATDARILESATGVPALIWVAAWITLSAIALFLSLRYAWKGKGNK